MNFVLSASTSSVSDCSLCENSINDFKINNSVLLQELELLRTNLSNMTQEREITIRIYQKCIGYFMRVKK